MSLMKRDEFMSDAELALRVSVASVLLSLFSLLSSLFAAYQFSN